MARKRAKATPPQRRDRHSLIATLAEWAAITFEALEEDTAPEGCFSYGDEAQDRAAEEDVRQRRERTPWGWCCVKTTASFGGFRGVAYLGCCSYESEEDFRSCQGETETWSACEALLTDILNAQQQGKEATKLIRGLRAECKAVTEAGPRPAQDATP